MKKGFGFISWAVILAAVFSVCVAGITEAMALDANYAAELKIKGKVESEKEIKFTIEAINQGQVTWEKKADANSEACAKKPDCNVIRFGCRVYNADKPVTAVLELRDEIKTYTFKGGKAQGTIVLEKKDLSKGKYKLKFDMVNELKFWFEDKGGTPLVDYIEIN